MIDKGTSRSIKNTNSKKVPISGVVTGFSLMELLVVIVIIGVIAAIGTPQLLGMRTRSSVRSDARDLHSAYRQAQTEAVKRSEIACVEITPGNPTMYQIRIADYFRTIEPGWSTDLPAKELRAGNSVDIASLGGEDPCFNFRGLPESGVGTITVSNPSLTMVVTLSLSGHVKSENL